LALVSCPVALHSTTRPSGDLRFHFINPQTGHRVRMVMVDAEIDREVSRQDLARGYEVAKMRYVCSTIRISTARASRPLRS
jgi:DNA end-binding protein Ku